MRYDIVEIIASPVSVTEDDIYIFIALRKPTTEAASSHNPTAVVTDGRRVYPVKIYNNNNNNITIDRKKYDVSADARVCVCVSIYVRYDEQCNVLPGAVNLDGRLGESSIIPTITYIHAYYYYCYYYTRYIIVKT